ncbi:MAG: glutamine--fructose-6-phosphate transaminase (isomerizing) [Clostridia bacterium]|nr:glutamine--fructose-6-phosphate transaminase (isomerizing) [Clostridia bacterium]
MCGIVGYVGKNEALPILIDSLAKLEYRGYDSAGVAFIDTNGLSVVKRKGRLAVLERELRDSGRMDRGGVHIGIGHTRWATHGAPSDENSHPHLSNNGRIAVVHNGIIENFKELRDYLTSLGYIFRSDTDTEVISHLVEHHYTGRERGNLVQSVLETMQEIEGTYALGVVCSDTPDLFVAARKDSPLIVGLGEDGNFIASDIPAILAHTREVIILEDREVVEIRSNGVRLFDALGHGIKRQPIHVDWDVDAAEKGGFEHFMIKEIHEEPRAVRDTLSPRIRDGRIVIPDLPLTRERLESCDMIHIIACGTAYHAGMVGKYLFERLCRIPVSVDVASEFRYRDPLVTDRSLAIVISQSGETLDTLIAMRVAREKGALCIALVNVVGSSIAREADHVLYTHAGPEIAVASTKAYNTQLAALYLLSLHAADLTGRINPEEYNRYVTALQAIPDKLEETLQAKERIARFASAHYNAKSVFFIGRGLDYALSMEASLKLKEISYIHSEAYPGGELKHGTIALIEEGTLVVCPMTQPSLVEKAVGNVREVKARGAVVLGLATPETEHAATVCDDVVMLPDADPLFTPILAVTPAQLFAYYVAVHKGCDVDKPRNLAKSVTVE